jgi:DNA-binding winged helix-turn-helix (wHTH) protein/TolB-like protein
MKAEFRVGDWLVEPSLGRISRGSQTVALRAKVMDLLVFLAEHPGEVLSKDGVLDGVWGTESVSESALTRTISELRQGFGDDVGKPQILETIPKRGYRLIAPVTSIETSRPDTPLASGARSDGIPHPGLWLTVAAVVLITFAVGTTAAWRRMYSSRTSDPGVVTLAVLPLENLSGKEEQQWFSDSMHDVLTTYLSRMSGFRVSARQATLRYRGSAKPPGQIARELGVELLVTGGVMLVGNRVRITAQMVDPRTNSSRRTFYDEREMRDILRIQANLAAEICVHFNAPSTPAARRRLETMRDVNPEAYEAFLRGRSLYRDKRDFRKGLELLDRAAKLEPENASVRAELAMAYADDGLFGRRESITAAAQARAHADQAVLLDADDSRPHVVLGRLHLFYDWNWPKAELELKEALRLNANDYAALKQWSQYLVVMSRFPEAQQAATRARLLDPLSGDRDLGWILFMMHEYDAAIGRLKAAFELKEDEDLSARTAVSYLMLERKSEAMEQCDALLRRKPRPGPAALGLCAHVYGAVGRRDDAKKLIGALESQIESRQLFDPWYLAVAYAGSGDRAKTLSLLERAFRQRSWNLFGIRMTPYWDRVRNEPRFQAIVRALNFPN